MATTKLTLSAKPPAQAGEDLSTLSFEVLQSRFEASSCENDSFALATAMYANDFHKAMKLLPLNFNAYSAEPTTTPPVVDKSRLDFNRDGDTTSHEWSSALVAAKKLKNIAGAPLDVAATDQVIDEAQKIYTKTRKEEPICRPL
jgi:hypothetical protein